MQNITNLPIRNSKFPWVTGVIVKQYDTECPERPDFPEWVVVRWDDGYGDVVIKLKYLEARA